MKVNELIQTGARIEQRTRIVPATYDDKGQIITEETTELYEVEVPVMGVVYRDMTAEEEAEMLAHKPKDEIVYKEQVEALIRERYTVSDELAILRQRNTKPDEFAEYNVFCEECKAKAKGLITEANDNSQNNG